MDDEVTRRDVCERLLLIKKNSIVFSKTVALRLFAVVTTQIYDRRWPR